ncbi:halocyanin domain-containing protein [Haloferax larsenii]|uniref:Halocyanin domain-containing protein n=1 Tax=Haloferax larsenii TaxID=302484 RepID=A0A1H7P7Z1_HALLR|nr:halocyanin domain-containing protein [Haloferax larsenii]SEL31930.1 halocyanin domain-containing protein [Haloferax larsenii]
MTTSDTTNPTLGRRNVLRLLGCAALSSAAVAGSPSTASAQSGSTDLDAWFENTSNYDGIVDKTGASEVTVTVGSQANGGAFGFSPAAIRVDPGTKVVWKWTGEGGVHDVTAEDESFGSELVGDEGHTFEHTFDSEGVYKYICTPHTSMGMRGAVVVGDVATGGAAESASSESNAETESGGSDVSTDLDTWFENTSNYDGVVDKTGLARVEVTVGSEANGGAFGFGPAAIRVTKGTTVVWRWTGGGGSHNVVHTDGAFESKLVSDEGHTFEYTFDETGTFPYACVPHESMGMKGAVVVASEEESGSNAKIAEPFDDPGIADLGGIALAGVFGTAMATPALYGVVSWLKEQSSADE